MLISLVHDGQLTDAERQFLEQAVARYPELKLEIHRHERLHGLLAMIPDAAAPPGIEDRVLEAIRPNRAADLPGRVIPVPRWRLPVQVAGAIAAAVVVVFVALLSYPLLTGTGHKTAALAPAVIGTSTASVTMSEAPPAAEDVAIVPPPGENEFRDSLMAGGGLEDTAPPSPERGMKSLSPELSPSAVMTATGVTAEKVSRVIVPARSAPISTVKKEAPMSSTTYIVASPPGGELYLPTILLVYHDDPAQAQKDIMDKAVSLGATMTRPEPEAKDTNDRKIGTDMELPGEEAQSNLITLPPEKIDEMLDYLVSRHPEILKEVGDLRARKTSLYIRVDVVPTVQ